MFNASSWVHVISNRISLCSATGHPKKKMEQSKLQCMIVIIKSSETNCFSVIKLKLKMTFIVKVLTVTWCTLVYCNTYIFNMCHFSTWLLQFIWNLFAVFDFHLDFSYTKAERKFIVNEPITTRFLFISELLNSSVISSGLSLEYSSVISIHLTFKFCV